MNSLLPQIFLPSLLITELKPVQILARELLSENVLIVQCNYYVFFLTFGLKMILLAKKWWVWICQTVLCVFFSSEIIFLICNQTTEEIIADFIT